MASIYALRKPLNMVDALQLLGTDYVWVRNAELYRELLTVGEHQIAIEVRNGNLIEYTITAGGRAELEDYMAEKLDAISEHDDDDPDWKRLFGEDFDNGPDH